MRKQDTRIDKNIFCFLYYTCKGFAENVLKQSLKFLQKPDYIDI